MGDISGEIRCVKVKFLGSSIEQVRWGSNDNPDGVLVKDAEYELLREEVHTSHTKYHLKDFPGKRFNSASFEPSRIYGGWNAYESPASPSPTQREPEDEMLVALDDTTTCLGNLLGTLIVHYPDFAANHLVKADVDIAVMRLHLSKELLIHLKGEPALEFKPTSFCEECCNAICTCAATQREEASRDTQLEKLDHVASELFVALRGIIDIGKRDMSNPKYAPYFDHAKEVLDRLSKQAYAAPGPSLPTEPRDLWHNPLTGELVTRDKLPSADEILSAALPTEAPRVEDGWISVKDRMPDYGVPVLVVYQGVVQYIAYARDIGEFRPITDDYDAMPENALSHWMPLPKPPAAPRHRDPEDK